MEFNINHYVKVKLTERGRKILKEQHEELIRGPLGILGDMKTYKPKKEDGEGWSTWQMWDLMVTLGRYCYMGPMPPFETEIIINEESEGSDD